MNKVSILCVGIAGAAQGPPSLAKSLYRTTAGSWMSSKLHRIFPAWQLIVDAIIRGSPRSLKTKPRSVLRVSSASWPFTARGQEAHFRLTHSGRFVNRGKHRRFTKVTKGADAINDMDGIEEVVSPDVYFERLFDFAWGLQDDRNWSRLQSTPMRFSEIAHNAYVAPSSKHGLGLYAARDLEKDTIVTFYPVHSIGWCDPNTLEGALMHWREHELWNDQAVYRLAWGHKNDLTRNAFIEADVQRADVQGWLGHRANDAAICSFTNQEAVQQYMEKSTRERNCVTVPFGNAAPIMALLTNRAVHKNEELLISYGCNYWLEQANGEVSPEILVKAAEYEINHDMSANDLVSTLNNISNRYQDEIDYFKKLLQEQFAAELSNSVTNVTRRLYL